MSFSPQQEAALKAVASTPWRHISDAPKDGSAILVGRFGCGFAVASWPAHLKPEVQALVQWPKLELAAGDGLIFQYPTHFALVTQAPEVMD